jgi:hypothetical protein
MPTEDPAVFEKRRADWLNRYQIQSPAAHYYLNMCITAEVQAERCHDAHNAALVRNADMVAGAFERARDELVDQQVEQLATCPAEASAGLRRSGAGCLTLIERLAEAAEVLSTAGFWSLDMAAGVVRLLGSDPDPEQIGASETVYRVYLYNLQCQPEPRAPEAAVQRALLSLPQHRPAVLRGVDLKACLPAPDACRQWLRELVEAELATLRLLEEAFRTGKDAAAYRHVMNRAKLLPECETSRQYNRYLREADSRFGRGHKRLEETVKADAAHAAGARQASAPGCRDAGPAPEPPANGTIVKSATPSGSPNEPGNRMTVTTGADDGPPAGAMPAHPGVHTPGSVVLVLLGLLLGQIFGGWGRVVHPAPQRTARPEVSGAAPAGQERGTHQLNAPRGGLKVASRSVNLGQSILPPRPSRTGTASFPP